MIEDELPQQGSDGTRRILRLPGFALVLGPIPERRRKRLHETLLDVGYPLFSCFAAHLGQFDAGKIDYSSFEIS